MTAITFTIGVFSLIMCIAIAILITSEPHVDMSDADEHFRYVTRMRAAEQLSIGDAVYDTIDGLRKADASLYPHQGEIGYVTTVYENGYAMRYSPSLVVHSNVVEGIVGYDILPGAIMTLGEGVIETMPSIPCIYCGNTPSPDHIGPCEYCGGPR